VIGTEQKLWEAMRRECPQGLKLARIETATHDGVADVEYVSRTASGWIELKTSSAVRTLRLHHPLSVQQMQWVIEHHAPTRNLRSYVLIGILGPRTWRGLVLLEPPAIAFVVKGRKTTALAKVLAHPKARWFKNVAQALEAL